MRETEVFFGGSSADSSPRFTLYRAIRFDIVPVPMQPDRKTIYISDLADSRVVLRRPIPVSLEAVRGTVTALSPDTSDYAFAEDEADAIDQLKASIVDLYFQLTDASPNLGHLPTRQWRVLSSVIDEIG